MTTFKLDTSGVVGGGQGVHDTGYEWSDLSPFEQGYVEAALQSLANGHGVIQFAEGWRKPRFSDFAPETLGRIMEDCAAFTTAHPSTTGWSTEDGQTYWAAHPQTLHLSDDGKLRFTD